MAYVIFSGRYRNIKKRQRFKLRQSDTLGCDNGSNEQETITFIYCAKAIGDNAKYNVALSF
jgi:hypothetical protein